MVTPVRSKRLLGWAALTTLLVASGFAVHAYLHPAPAPVTAAPPNEPSKPQYPRKAGAKLLPMPKSPRGPSFPRWAHDGAASPDTSQGVADHQTLKNGIEAKMFVGKSSYPASAPVDVHLELFTPEGEPVTGRADLSFDAFDSFHTDQNTIRLNFAERPDNPGVYDAVIAAPESWKRVTVLSTINERGTASDPGEGTLIQLQVDHSAPASLANVVGAKLSQSGTEVVVALESDRPGRAAVRAELRDGEGQSFGDAFGVAEVGKGPGKVALVFPTLRTSHASASHAFYLADLTLFIDEAPADFRKDPVPISLRN
jgi:hypothetical protein